jgi:formate hydrogenlyase subunit 4
VFLPFGLVGPESPTWAYGTGIAAYAAKLTVGGALLALVETTTAKMRVFRVSGFLGAALMLGFLGTLLLFVSRAL